MDNLEKIYNIIWSIGAIGLGSIGVFYTDWYIAHTIRWARWFYEKTKFPFFKLQIEETGKSYIRVSIKLIGFAFAVLGILSLLGKLPART